MDPWVIPTQARLRTQASFDAEDAEKARRHWGRVAHATAARSAKRGGKAKRERKAAPPPPPETDPDAPGERPRGEWEE